MLIMSATVMLVLGATQLHAQSNDMTSERSDAWRRSHALMLENIGFFLDGAVEVDLELGAVKWKISEAAIHRRLERIVLEVASLQSLPAPWVKGGFSEEVRELIAYVSRLDHRDLRRWRMADNLTEEEQWYVLVQSGLDELKMQIAMELNHRVNTALFDELKSVLAIDEVRESNSLETNWLDLDTNAPLPLLSLELSTASAEDLLADDRSVWPRSETQNMEMWMERILFLLESQEQRLILLEGQNRTSQMNSLLKPVQSDGALSQLRLPDQVAVLFASGSSQMTLNSQLKVNEVMELLCRHPQIRVVCTGHADHVGGRAHNHQLSKQRARAVRDFILQTGLESDRVLLNYFGEERLNTSTASDRRVEIRFFVE
tara:strand:- start:2143 stop:3261 length:1119 start_codon:yes stop_codon:yes gene_type:complete